MSSRTGTGIKFIESQSTRRTDRFNSASAIITTTSSNSNKNKINDSAKNNNKNESTTTIMNKASTTTHGVSSSSSSLTCLLRTLLRHKEADAARLQAENDRLKQLLVKQQSLLNKLNEDNLVLANSQQQQLLVGHFNESNESISRPMSHGDDDEDDEEYDHHQQQQQQRVENRLPSSPLRHNNNSLKNDTIIGNNFEYVLFLLLYIS